MLSSDTLRNALLRIIREKLVPWAREGEGVSMMAAQLPLIAPPGAQVKHANIEPLQESNASRHPQHGVFHRFWPGTGFHTSRYACLGCILDGNADLEICPTSELPHPQAEAAAASQRHILMLPRGTFFFIPAEMPHNDGSRLHWYRPHPETARSQILWIYVLPAGVVCHTCSTSGLEHDPGPSIFIRDAHLATLAELLLEEMQERAKGHELIAQAHLTAFLLRAQRNLSAGHPLITDRALRVYPSGEEIETGAGTPQQSALRRACAYIRNHLEAPLTPLLIARHAYVSPSHLNRIFEAEMRLSIMKYVTHCRLETAKSLLEDTDLPVAEISHLVGYKYLSHFSQTFSQHTGRSPVAYRKGQPATPGQLGKGEASE